MDLQMIVDWTIKISQVVIALGIITGAIIVKPWKHASQWIVELNERRKSRKFSPPITKEDKKARSATADVSLSLSRTDKWFGVGIRNYSHYATARDVKLKLDGIPSEKYPTRVGKCGMIRRLKPKRAVVRWFRYDNEPHPSTVSITWINRDGSVGSHSMKNN